LAAYIAATVLATGFAFTLIWSLHLKTAAQLGISRAHDPGFLLSRPYIIGINLVCWTTFAALYYRGQRRNPLAPREAISTALLWLVLAMGIDLVFFVLIPTPISLTAHEFYIDYQPWITLTYGSVLGGHALYYFFYWVRGRNRPR